VTYDRFVSMPYGPVPSSTLDLINRQFGDYWPKYISERRGDVVTVLAEVPNDQLSPAQEKLIDEVFARFGKMRPLELVTWCHKHLPEWKNPEGSSVPIEIRTILRAEGVSEADTAAILDGLRGEALAAETLR
jgi:hypothetical protein